MDDAGVWELVDGLQRISTILQFTVKESAQLYLEFVSHRGHAYGELQSCFSVIGLSGKLNSLTQSKNAQLNVEAFDFIKLSIAKRAQINKTTWVK